MRARPAAVLLAEELAAKAVAADADEVRIWVEDSCSTEYRLSHDDAEWAPFGKALNKLAGRVLKNENPGSAKRAA